MSWHYVSWPCSQGPVVASWEENSSDGIPSALSKLIPTRDQSYSHGKGTEHCHAFRYGTMFEHLMGRPGVALSMSSAVDSLARISAVPGKNPESMGTNRDFGKKWPESFAKFDPVSCSWKTRQTLLVGGLESFSETWPRWGMMQNGECWALDTLEPHTKGIESGLLPTPTATNTKAVHKRTGGRPARVYQEGGGQLNPPWVEWLMGWPIGQTDLEPLETDRFRQWLDSHGKH